MATEASEGAQAGGQGVEAPNAGEQGETNESQTSTNDDHRSRVDRRNAELAKTVKELQAELDTYKSEKQKTTEALQREQGKWEELLSSRDAALSEREKAIAERDAKLQAYENRETERGILERMSAQAPDVPAKRLRGVYLAMLEDRGIDRFPSGEDVNLDKVAKERLSKLNEYDPELFGGTQTGGGSPPTKTTGKGGKGKRLSL